jgi:hypothetical protein
MAEDQQAPTADPEAGYTPPPDTSPTVVGDTAGGAPGYVDVRYSDGTVVPTHVTQLSDDLAIQHAANQNQDITSVGAVGTNADGTPMMPAPGQVPPPAPVPGANTVGSSAPVATTSSAPARSAPWSGAAIPQGVGFGPQGQAPAQPPPVAAPTKKTGGGGGGGLPSDKVFADLANDTAAAQADAYTAVANVATKQAAGELAVGQQESEQAANSIKQRQYWDQYYGQKAQDALQKSQQIAGDFLNKQVDPNRYWGNMSTGDHALAGLSMILSGIGAGIQGGGAKNLAVEHFNTAVENDIQAQRYNIEHGKEASEMYSKLASDFQAAGMSKQHALDATDLTIKNKALVDAKNVGLSLGGDKAAADLEMHFAPLHMQAQKDQQELKKGVLDNAATQSRIQTEAVSRAHMGLENEQLANQIKQQGVQAANLVQLGLPPGTNLANVVRGTDGSLGVAPSPEALKDYNTEAKPAQDIHQVLDRIDAARKAGVVPNQAELESLAGRLQQVTAEIGGEKETARNEEIIKAMTGDPSQYFSLRPSTNWANREKALREIANDQQNGAASRHNITFVRKPKSMLTRTDVGG